MWTEFSPAMTSFIDVSRDAFALMRTKDAALQKSITPEVFDYYNTSLLWLRVVSLKLANRQTLTIEEETLVELMSETPLTVTDPIKLYLEGVGNVTPCEQSHLFPSFPPLPTNIINGRGGYYGNLNADTHSLYEEVPCLGVLAEAVCQSVSNSPAGPYVSALSPLANANLQGLRNLGLRRPEAKELAVSAGVTAAEFPSDVSNAAFNVQLVMQVSSYLSTTRTFKTHSVNYFHASPSGSLAQIISTSPQTHTGRDSLSEIGAASTAELPVADYGAAIVFGYCQLKLDDGHPQNWACISPTTDHPVPHNWIANRNDRRNLPAEFTQRIFRVVSRPANTLRYSILQNLMLSGPG